MSHKAYHREIKRDWFLSHPFYKRYMLREASAIFLLLYSFNLICGLQALYQSKAAWLDWADKQSSVGMVLFAVISFLMALYHSYTWFQATPKVMPLQKGAKRIPAKMIVYGHWVVFAVISLVILIGVAV